MTERDCRNHDEEDGIVIKRNIHIYNSCISDAAEISSSSSAVATTCSLSSSSSSSFHPSFLPCTNNTSPSIELYQTNQKKQVLIMMIETEKTPYLSIMTSPSLSPSSPRSSRQPDEATFLEPVSTSMSSSSSSTEVCKERRSVDFQQRNENDEVDALNTSIIDKCYKGDLSAGDWKGSGDNVYTASFCHPTQSLIPVQVADRCTVSTSQCPVVPLDTRTTNENSSTTSSNCSVYNFTLLDFGTDFLPSCAGQRSRTDCSTATNSSKERISFLTSSTSRHPTASNLYQHHEQCPAQTRTNVLLKNQQQTYDIKLKTSSLAALAQLPNIISNENDDGIEVNEEMALRHDYRLERV